VPFWDFATQAGERLGLNLHLIDGRQIMDQIATMNPAFERVSYVTMDEQGGIVLAKESMAKSK
jgi:predicted molibdopterin-dependent oxidoreductase YjgC